MNHHDLAVACERIFLAFTLKRSDGYAVGAVQREGNLAANCVFFLVLERLGMMWLSEEYLITSAQCGAVCEQQESCRI